MVQISSNCSNSSSIRCFYGFFYLSNNVLKVKKCNLIQAAFRLRNTGGGLHFPIFFFTKHNYNYKMHSKFHSPVLSICSRSNSLKLDIRSNFTFSGKWNFERNSWNLLNWRDWKRKTVCQSGQSNLSCPMVIQVICFVSPLFSQSTAK